jgi:hypothetical protein
LSVDTIILTLKPFFSLTATDQVAELGLPLLKVWKRQLEEQFSEADNATDWQELTAGGTQSGIETQLETLTKEKQQR